MMGVLMFSDNHMVKSIFGAGAVATTLFFGVESFDYTYNRETINFKYADVSESYNNIDFTHNRDIISLRMIPLDYLDDDIYDYPEVEIVEIPVVKKVVFQFSKPVRLKFS